MNKAEYAEMYKLESFYWWFVARRRLLEWLVGNLAGEFGRPIILDVGCGTGINSVVLAEYGDTISTDASEEALGFSKGRGLDGLVRAHIESLPFQGSSFDLITALDVLEHIDDDLAALDELLRVVRQGGVLVITV